MLKKISTHHIRRAQIFPKIKNKCVLSVRQAYSKQRVWYQHGCKLNHSTEGINEYIYSSTKPHDSKFE